MTADHKFLTEEQVSRTQHNFAVVVQVLANRFTVNHAKLNQLKRRNDVSDKFYVQKKAQDPLTDNSLEFYCLRRAQGES